MQQIRNVDSPSPSPSPSTFRTRYPTSFLILRLAPAYLQTVAHGPPVTRSPARIPLGSESPARPTACSTRCGSRWTYTGGLGDDSNGVSTAAPMHCIASSEDCHWHAISKCWVAIYSFNISIQVREGIWPTKWNLAFDSGEARTGPLTRA